MLVDGDYLQFDCRRGWRLKQERTTTSSLPRAEESGSARVERQVGDRDVISAAEEGDLTRYLVPDQEAYEQAKAEAAEKAEQLFAERAPAAPPATTSPQIFRSWEGIRDPSVAPSDSTGAIGPTRYIELINLKYAIYNRTSDTPIDTGEPTSCRGTPVPRADVFDPRSFGPALSSSITSPRRIIATDNRLAFASARPPARSVPASQVTQFGSGSPTTEAGCHPTPPAYRGHQLRGIHLRVSGADLISLTTPPAAAPARTVASSRSTPRPI